MKHPPSSLPWALGCTFLKVSGLKRYVANKHWNQENVYRYLESFAAMASRMHLKIYEELHVEK